MSDKSELGDVGLFPSVYPGVKISLEAEPISERLNHVASPETALAATARRGRRSIPRADGSKSFSSWASIKASRMKKFSFPINQS